MFLTAPALAAAPGRVRGRGRPSVRLVQSSERAVAAPEIPPEPTIVERWDVTYPAREPVPADERCPGCGGPTEWSPARTVVLCVGCDSASLPASVTEPAPAAEVALRPDRTAERHALVLLAAEREQACAVADGWVAVFDPAGLSDDMAYRARGWRAQWAELRGQFRAVADQLDLAEVGAVAERVAALCASDLAAVQWARESQPHVEGYEDAESWDEDEPAEIEPEPLPRNGSRLSIMPALQSALLDPALLWRG